MPTELVEGEGFLVPVYLPLCSGASLAGALVERVAWWAPLAKAIGYARNQREALHTFLNGGPIPIHNNRSER